MAISIRKPGSSSRNFCSLWHTTDGHPSLNLDLFHEQILTMAVRGSDVCRFQANSKRRWSWLPSLFFPTLWKWQGLENLRHQRLGQHSTAASSGPWWPLDLKPSRLCYMKGKSICTLSEIYTLWIFVTHTWVFVPTKTFFYTDPLWDAVVILQI